MKILAVDSSSITASAALTDDKKVVSEFFVNAGLTHSQTLAPMIDYAVKTSGYSLQDIDLFAVTNGPGSFTGLRIGVSTVKAMSLALGKPCVGVSSLFALAMNFRTEGAVVCACMDARRGQLYNALFKMQNGYPVKLTGDRAITVTELVDELSRFEGDVIEIVGDGGLICYNEASKVLPQDVRFLPEKNRYIKASELAAPALEKFMAGEYTDACGLSLNYIRVSQAERLRKEKEQKIKS